MKLFKRVKSHEPLVYETQIYERLENWFSDLGEAAILKERIYDATGYYKRLLIQDYLRRDFLRTFTVICELACQNNARDKQSLQDTVRNVIGYVIGDIIFETTEIQKLRAVLNDFGLTYPNELMQWIDDRREGKVWILDTFIDRTIEYVLLQNEKYREIAEIPKEWRITLEDYAKYDLALFSGTSLTEVESMLVQGIAHTYLHDILYGYIMRMILMDGLENDLYPTGLLDKGVFIGYSGTSHFFDSIIILEEDDKENPWLLKCISTYSNPLEAIEGVDTKLDDLGMNKCILFLPMNPSRKALRYSIYAYTEKKHEIMLLYRYDLFMLLGMKEGDVKGYLKGKRIN